MNTCPPANCTFQNEFQQHFNRPTLELTVSPPDVRAKRMSRLEDLSAFFAHAVLGSGTCVFCVGPRTCFLWVGLVLVLSKPECRCHTLATLYAEEIGVFLAMLFEVFGFKSGHGVKNCHQAPQLLDQSYLLHRTNLAFKEPAGRGVGYLL